jgi:hypothetical protein
MVIHINCHQQFMKEEQEYSVVEHMLLFVVLIPLKLLEIVIYQING